MKTLDLITIIVSMFLTLFVTSQAYAPCIEGYEINCNGYPPHTLSQIHVDKINYETQDKPIITISGVPSTAVHLEIDDSSSNIMFEHDLTLSSNGTAQYILDISSYQSGVYSTTATSLMSKVTTGFTVGMTPSGGNMHLDIDKNSYLPGDQVSVLGTANSNTLIQLSLIDPSGTSIRSAKTFSDKTGHFSLSNFTIPINVVSGIWQIGATGGVMHVHTQIVVNSTNHSYGMKTDNAITPSPLKQFKSGIDTQDVKCRKDLMLVIKTTDGSPACVKPDTVQKLIERGWARDQLQQKSENIATNYSSALKLSLSTNSTIIQSGHAIGITLSLDNTRSSLLNLNSQNNWPIQGLDSGGCSWLPMGIAILDGYYTAQNMSDGHPMLLHFLYPCPPSLPVKTFTFQPMSSNITVTCEPGDWAPCQYLTQTKTSVAYSSFLQDGKFFDFNPGNYTLVAGDEWGDSAIQHFQVVNSTRTHIEYDPPIVTQTYDIHGTVKDIMPNTTFAKLASSSTGIQMAHGEGLDTYDNDSIKLELNYGNTSDSHVISATVENLGKRTVHIYDIFISGFIPLANDDHLNFVVVRGDPYIVSKNDAILEPGESVTKYIVGNWTVDEKPVNGFSAGASYSYDDLQNFDDMTNGYSMSIPVQWVK
ncbi:MAG: hypothetical protein LV477_04205 [Candidatus Nitrosotalea sp.]|nr:hypothetical protein [Candidatus Nitrosotalea sp.]